MSGADWGAGGASACAGRMLELILAVNPNCPQEIVYYKKNHSLRKFWNWEDKI
jgi:hypothetical protein